MKLAETNDGSSTFYSQVFGQHYHSVNGAYTESVHVFIKNGLEHVLSFVKKTEVRVFEMGLGTALNAALCWEFAQTNACKVSYSAVEKFPIGVEQLHGFVSTDSQVDEKLYRIHELAWEVEHCFDEQFKFVKYQADLEQIQFDAENGFDVVFYDAFSPDVQPELWSETVFRKMYNLLNNNGVLVTYSAKGIVKQALRAAGFTVKRLPGPPGKHHMLRATKFV